MLNKKAISNEFDFVFQVCGFLLLFHPFNASIKAELVISEDAEWNF
jgi:hypothetical protein